MALRSVSSAAGVRPHRFKSICTWKMNANALTALSDPVWPQLKLGHSRARVARNGARTSRAPIETTPHENTIYFMKYRYKPSGSVAVWRHERARIRTFVHPRLPTMHEERAQNCRLNFPIACGKLVSLIACFEWLRTNYPAHRLYWIRVVRTNVDLS